MPPADDAPAAPAHPSDRLRHELLTPVTVVSVRLGMLVRRVARSPTLADDERGPILADAEAIAAAVQSLCAVVDGLDDGGRDPDFGDERR